ncbi:Sterol uptake control protein 2 [Lasiodiplodia theobromae]|uniref:Sterol uptake control protein 2 n=1 Tax=Lasiodiplodia theobromae TaxID=45133 RepID=A0A5N5DA22_9PEZI|nr:Sterol uptake control protein 2 [Lasiodiplodia theobromae]
MLGAQCLSCKKRRVRCDSVQPSCGPCKKKGIDCPGFHKPLVWINRGTASEKSQPPTPARACTSFIFKAQRIKSSPKKDTDDVRKHPEHGAIVKRTRSSIPPPWPCADPRVLQLLDVAMYHNEFVAPTLVPDPAFATLFHSSLQEWVECPQTIQDIWVLLTKQFRAIQANITPDSDKEICRYRDRSINGLNRLLANPETQLCDETLDAIIMLLMAEVQSNASSTWYHHLHGAATIVELRGGWKKLLDTRQWESEMVLLMIFYDVMSSTTCNSQYLNKPLFSPAWADFADLKPRWDKFIYDSFAPLPWPLFWSMVCTNDIRGSMAHFNFNFCDSHDPGEERTVSDFRQSVIDILQQIHAFDPEAWFNNITPPLQLHNSRDYLTLVHCFKDAVMLYTIRTLLLELTSPFRQWLSSPLPESIFGTDNPEDLHRQYLRALLRRFGYTSAKYDISEVGLSDGGYAWSGCGWPLFLAGYELDDCAPPEEMREMREFVATKLKHVAMRIGTWSLFNAEALLQRIWKQRDEGNGPTWEEVFMEKQVLVG